MSNSRNLENSFPRKVPSSVELPKTRARGAGELSPYRIFPFLKGPGRYSARSWFEPVFLLSQCYVVRCPSPICTCWCAYPTLDGSLSFIITFSSVTIPVLSAHSVFVAGHFLLPLGGAPFPRGDHICPTFCPFAVTAAPGSFPVYIPRCCFATANQILWFVSRPTRWQAYSRTLGGYPKEANSASLSKALSYLSV